MNISHTSAPRLLPDTLLSQGDQSKSGNREPMVASVDEPAKLAVLATLTDDVSSTKCTKINYISKMNHIQNISTCSGRLMEHVFQR